MSNKPKKKETKNQEFLNRLKNRQKILRSTSVIPELDNLTIDVEIDKFKVTVGHAYGVTPDNLVTKVMEMFIDITTSITVNETPPFTITNREQIKSFYLDTPSYVTEQVLKAAVERWTAENDGPDWMKGALKK